MFSGNEKISGRQLYRNYTVCFISLGALLVPVVMNRVSAGAVGIALLLLGLYLAGSVWAPCPSSVFVKVLCYVHYWVLGTMIARTAGILIQEFLLTGTSLALILGWFYLFCYYNLYKGLECRIRVSEILFPFFLVMLLLLSLLMLGEVEPSRMGELEFFLGAEHLRTGYEMFVWLSAVQSLWHFKGCLQNPASGKKIVGAVWVSGTAAAVLWSMFTYSIYGNAGHTGLVFPLASAMTLAHFPGNVIGRLDTLFVFAWVMGLFLMCSTLFAPLQSGEPDLRRKYLLFALLAASFGLALRPECMDWCQTFLGYVSVPIQIFLLLWHGLGRRKRKLRLSVMLLLPLLLVTGCGNQELEERSMVTAIGVDMGQENLYFTFGFGTSNEEEKEEPFGTEAASIGEAEKLYYASSRKNMDFNHLKNFYFSKEVLESEKFLSLLEEIQIEGSYSRGTFVYGTEGLAALEAEKEKQPEEGTPVHRILNAWYNKETCEIPSITEGQMYKGVISWPY